MFIKIGQYFLTVVYKSVPQDVLRVTILLLETPMGPSRIWWHFVIFLAVSLTIGFLASLILVSTAADSMSLANVLCQCLQKMLTLTSSLSSLFYYRQSQRPKQQNLHHHHYQNPSSGFSLFMEGVFNKGFGRLWIVIFICLLTLLHLLLNRDYYTA